jgi:hypothetical protein
MSKQQTDTYIRGMYGNYAKGFIPLDITQLRIIAANEVGVVNATDGGQLASDTAPILGRVSTNTDKALRVTWAAGVTAETQFPTVPLPPDYDNSADLEVHLMCGKDANANTVTIDVQAYSGVGDTEMGAATATIAQARAEYTVSLTGANVGAHPGFVNISLVPSAHAGDALYLYAAWLEYTRKS